MFVRYFLLYTLFFFHLYSDSASFTTNPTQITPYSEQVYADVSSCYNSKSNQVVFSWNDKSKSYPWYAIYDVKSGNFITTPTRIPGYNSSGVFFDVFCCYNSISNQVIFTWADNTIENNPWYAIYDVKSGNFTTLPVQIPGYNSGVKDDVFCCYNSTSNQVIFSWTSFPGNNPYYAIYDVNSGNFSIHPTQIASNIYNSGVHHDVFCCYNSIFNQVIFTWADNTSSHHPWYTIYDVKNDSFSTMPTQIPGDSNGVYSNVFCCYNSISNQVVFSWKDIAVDQPWYAIYDANKKLFSIPSTQILGYNNGVFENIFCCYNSTSNRAIFSWADTIGTEHPWYAIYDVKRNNFTTEPTQIDQVGYNNGVTASVFCCYINISNQVVFSWADSPGEKPYYVIYKEPVSSVIEQKRLLRAVNLYSPQKPQKGITSK